MDVATTAALASAMQSAVLNQQTMMAVAGEQARAQAQGVLDLVTTATQMAPPAPGKGLAVDVIA